MKQSLIYFFGALGGFLFGYSTGIISGALHYIGTDLKIVENSLEEGALTAIILVGAVAGAVAIGKLADKLGRRTSLFISAVLFVVGALLSGLAGSLEFLLLARLIMGLAVGAVSSLVPLYLSELAPTSRRGSLAFLNQLMIVLGIVFAYTLNYLFSEFGTESWNSSTGWRISLAFVGIPALLLLIGVFKLPESPRYLFRINNVNAARDVLLKLRTAREVEVELEELKSSQSVRTASLKELTSKFVRPALVAGVGLAFFQQFMGINVIIYYSPKVLETVGFDNQGQRLSTIAIGVMNVIATLLAIKIVNHVNRRTLLISGGIVMGVALFSLALLTITDRSTVEDQTIVHILTLVLMLIYIFTFGVTWGGVMWIVLAEIFPTHVRGLGIGITSGVNWVSNFTITLLFPFLLGHAAYDENCFDECNKATMLGGHPFWIFIVLSVFAFVAAIFIRFKLFETRGKSLEEIESELQMHSLSKNKEK
ncbi:MAG: sugar porter family MFS transporter [Candidatus Ancillula sp.]|jgi:sugar porter (SP) family MFS transporter|nr:sugar porter family MFS transporter [Candidatus Ancillula sp.]